MILCIFHIKDFFTKVLKGHIAVAITNLSKDNIGKKIEIEVNKHWHFMWSKFYFYKKNFSYLVAIKNTFFEFIKDLIMIIIFTLKIDKHNFFIRLYRISGLLCSCLGIKSYLRFSI